MQITVLGSECCLSLCCLANHHHDEKLSDKVLLKRNESKQILHRHGSISFQIKIEIQLHNELHLFGFLHTVYTVVRKVILFQVLVYISFYHFIIQICKINTNTIQ